MINIQIIVRKHRNLRMPLTDQVFSHLVTTAEIVCRDIHEIRLAIQISIDRNNTFPVFFTQALQLTLCHVTHDQALEIPRDCLL